MFAIRTASVASRNEEKRAVAVTIRSRTDELYPCSSSPRAVRRGEKIPSAIGTVSDAFDLLDGGSLSGERSCMGFGGTRFAAVWTGLLVGELTGLLLEEELERSFGEPLCSGGGDLLEGAEVYVEAGSVFTKCPFGNDLCPSGSEVVEFLEFLRREVGRRHGSSCLVVASMTGEDFLSRTQNTARPTTNHELTSDLDGTHCVLGSASS
jgi:hypothetical protein